MGIYPPNDVDELAAESLRRGDPTGWFERVYARADGQGSGIPWARLSPEPGLVAWLDESGLAGQGAAALVVGCGLGDDAEELARRGFTVTAFDIAPSAIALCRERFPASRVDYRVADLFDPPREWRGAFHLVVEVTTAQALPLALHEQAIQQIAGFVAPGGWLFVETSLRDPSLENPSGPPWPLAAPLLRLFEQAGLSEQSHEARPIGDWTRVWLARAIYRRAT